ncbi:MAG: signal peptide peptidase SppA [Candidatus Schekmanbacteria bacterium]|nr:MAG: signal peptide peptidase SppA [Candidatus Schekmanbacteria bacterium]
MNLTVNLYYSSLSRIIEMTKERIFSIIIIVVSIFSVIAGIILLSRKVPEKTTFETSALKSVFPIKKDSIAVVNIYGEISFSPVSLPLSMMRGADAIVDQIDRFSKDSRVKAIILRINSPGGTVGATQEIFDAVIRAKQKGIKVVASLGDIAASGGYYIACACDRIISNKGTITGSIGVLITSPNLNSLFKKYGIKYNVIKSGAYKDTLAFWRDLTDEERKLLQNTVDNVYEQFLFAVAGGRNIEVSKLRKIADGRIFSGQEAMEAGLVDELGGFDKAVKVAAELAGIKGEPNLIRNVSIPLERLFEFFEKDSGNRFNRYLSSLPTPVKYLYSGNFDIDNNLITLR